MAETKARFLANLIGATNTDNDFTLPNTAVSGTNNKVLTSGGDGTVTWEATELAPETTSISPTEVASDAGGNITFTLTGTNYGDSGMTVHFIATSGSDITSGMTVTHTSSTSLTVEIARSAFVDANEPYSIKVTKTSGLTHTLANALRVDNAPSWSTYVGTLSGSPPVVATVEDIETSSQITARNIAISAVDAEGDTVTYSETTNTLTNAGMTLSSAGAITGTPTAVSSDTNYDFTARATSTGDGGATTKTTDQNFRFTIINYVPQLFAGLAYTGTDNTSSKVFNETNDFQPDLVWIKNRTEGYDGHLYDTIRGPQYNIRSSSTATNSNSGTTTNLTAFDSDGFTVGSSIGVNGGSGDNYVAWAFKAGGAPTTDQASQVRTPTSGALKKDGSSVTTTNYWPSSDIYPKRQTINTGGDFSITKYTGTTSGQNQTKTIPHGLSGTPDLVIIKNLGDTTDWPVAHSSDTGNGFLNRDYDFSTWSYGYISGRSADHVTTHSGSDSSNYGRNVNKNGENYIMYCWKAVDGTSAFGSFNGNNTTDVTVTVGFQPRFVMIKNADSTGHWIIWDSFRGFGTNAYYFKANDSIAEVTVTGRGCTVTSNSFTPHHYHTQNTNKFIYMAFA